MSPPSGIPPALAVARAEFERGEHRLTERGAAHGSRADAEGPGFSEPPILLLPLGQLLELKVPLQAPYPHRAWWLSWSGGVRLGLEGTGLHLRDFSLLADEAHLRHGGRQNDVDAGLADMARTLSRNRG